MSDEEIIVKDSNGTRLSDGDSVTIIKDLKVKGSSLILKRGTLVKNIRLTDSDTEIDCRLEKGNFSLETRWLKKA